MTTAKAGEATLTAASVHQATARLTAAGGPFELAEFELDGNVYRGYKHAPQTVNAIINSGRNHGGTEFLVAGDERWTFEHFFGAVDALAHALQTTYGIKPGDRLAIAMRNCPDWLIVFAAAVSVGAIAVPINSWGSSEEIDYTIQDCGATLLAADLPRMKLAAKSLSNGAIAVLLSDVDGTLEAGDQAQQVRRIRDVVADQTDPAPVLAATPNPEDLAMLLYTSGSTGRPKGVCYRHIAVGQALMNMFFVGSLAAAFTEGAASSGGVEANLLTVPLFHGTGLFSGLLVPCMVGQRVALMRKWDASTALRLIESERITSLSTVPAIIKDLLTHPEVDKYDLSSLTRVAAAGAATPADLPDLIKGKIGIVARAAGYGMTETAAVGATMSGPIFDLNPLSSGVPSPIIEIRSEKPNSAAPDNERSPDTGGEIQLRGITVTPGYWHLDASTRDSFTDDGWIRSGDLGHVDEDGFLHITGRIKELIIRGGENIAPVEIENVAYRHPSVKEVAVVGVPDEAMGEDMVMVCHPRPGTDLTVDDLREHLSQSLPSFKVPKTIRITPEPLPRNASEKIHRLAIRRGLLDG